MYRQTCRTGWLRHWRHASRWPLPTRCPIFRRAKRWCWATRYGSPCWMCAPLLRSKRVHLWASTLTELAILGKPSILVPLPPAIGSSPQEANAAMFGRKQAALVILNDDLKPEILVERVKSILTSSTLLEAMSQAVSEFAKPEA